MYMKVQFFTDNNCSIHSFYAEGGDILLLLYQFSLHKLLIDVAYNFQIWIKTVT